MSFSFNTDGSLQAAPKKKKREHLPLLLALEELPFGVGKKLLIDHLRGRQNAKTIKLKLDQYMTFGDLGGYEDEELKQLIQFLEINNYLTHKKEKGIYQVYCLTTKGSEELQAPQLELNISNLQEANNEQLRIENPFPASTPITDQEQQLFKALHDFFPGFNERQQQAVINSNKNILCVAGAGSGKTSVLTKRIQFLITYKSVNPNKILAITFTRKARREMQERLAKMLPNIVIPVETFNSFSEKMLQQHGDKLYNKPVRMASFKEKLQLIIEVLKEHGYTQTSIIQHYFTKRQQQGKDPKTLFFTFSYDFHSLLDKIRLTDSTIESLRTSVQPNKEHATLAHTLLDMADAYLQKMQEMGLRDYTDQLVDALALCKQQPNIMPQYEHILVDEFQDVNDLQINLLKLLKPKNLFAVGDPRQSIYGWRGSKISHILNFAKEQDATIIQLTKNYRSTPEIVALCNEVIKTTGYEDLESASKNKGELTLHYYSSEDQQAQAITKAIKEYQGNRKNIFVLSRTNKGLDKIKNYFDTHNIPYLLRTDELKRPGIEAQEGQVTLATVHAIKGLEAKKVYLLNANNTNFPCKASDHPVMNLFHLQEDYDSYAEELRVLYVALSRPQLELHISYTGSLSTFFTDNAEKLLKKKITQKKLHLKPTRDQTALMMKLRQWRYNKAKGLGKPAYTVCTDATLEALITQQPRHEDDLYMIPGLGPAKVQAFGEELLDLLLK